MIDYYELSSFRSLFIDYIYWKEYWPEYMVDKWFRHNYKLLNFQHIEPHSPGDYIALRENEEIIIELEGHSAGFWLHKPHIREKINMVICYKASSKDEKRIPMEGIELIEIYDYVKYINEEIHSMNDIIFWGSFKKEILMLANKLYLEYQEKELKRKPCPHCDGTGWIQLSGPPKNVKRTVLGGLDEELLSFKI